MKVTGFCRLVRDNELKLSKNGTYYCKNAIAWNDAKKQVHYLDIVAYSHVAQQFEKLKKGAYIKIECDLVQDKWEVNGQKHSKHYGIVLSFEAIKNKNDPAIQDDIPF